MGSPVRASSSKARETNSKNPKTPLLDARRLSELMGLLTAVAGLLILLSLASFLPQDPSLDTAVATGSLPHNWIGPVGAFVADGLFQGFGWVAYFVPLILLVMGTRWLMGRPFHAPGTKALGAGMLVVSLDALLEIFPYTPAIHGAVRGSGVLGYLGAAGLIHTFNRVGAGIVAATVFLTSLFLVTRFSFGWAVEFLKNRWSGTVAPLKARWEVWKKARAARAAERQRKQMERQRVIGKPPVVLQKVAGGPPVAVRPTTPPPASTPFIVPSRRVSRRKNPRLCLWSVRPRLRWASPRPRLWDADCMATSCRAPPCYGLRMMRKELMKMN